MKKWFVLFLMLMLPLQSLLAEGQFLHALEKDSGTHSLSDVGECLHGHDQVAHSDSDSTEPGHHHHHCAGHCAVVLPSLLHNLHPDLKYDRFSPAPVLPASSFSTRIERPNWC